LAKNKVSSTELRAVRLGPILEQHRKKLAPELSKNLVTEIAEIEEQFQFDDSREEPKRRIRRALEIEVQERLMSEVADED
jgi:hypothetical protein